VAKPTEDQLYGEYRRWIAEPASSTVHLATRLNAFWSAAWDAAAREREREVTVTEGDMERFNREQRIRRGAYLRGVTAFQKGRQPLMDEIRTAAHVYPLKKRVPNVIRDPHNGGEWRVSAGEKPAGHPTFQWRIDASAPWIFPHEEEATLHWTHDRVRALSALLDDAWKWEDDPSVEEGEAT